ncbi:XRE family transcriptional regulator [Kitasatospora sp. NPDC058478]|uniref:MmyB family transcriptional regulator n=1 Tax=unclassified Kitasatospora TaxID=2633591 RepID=UPI003646CA93
MDKTSTSDRAALKAFLKPIRAKLDPADFDLLPPVRPTGSGRRAPGLAQEHIDHLTDRAPGTYGRFECSSSRSAIPPDYVETVARILRLTREQWRTLWHLVYHHQPPHTLDPEDGMTVGSQWETIVHAQSNPAYVNDLAWNVVAYNPEFASLFPDGIPPKNTMEWMVLSPYARETGLPDWASSWLPMVLPQLRAACTEYRHNRDLAELERRVEDDPVAGPVYASMADAYYQPDGDVRPMWHAGEDREITVTICPAMPLGALGARLMFLIPDYRPGPALRRAHPPRKAAPPCRTRT